MVKLKPHLIRICGCPFALQFREMGLQLRTKLISSSRRARENGMIYWVRTCRQQGFNDVKEVVYERVPSKLDGHQTRFQGCQRDVTLEVKAGFRIN